MKFFFKGPDTYSGDQPIRVFGKDMSEDERNKIIEKAYQHLKESFDKFKKPDGKKNSPAKTCRDIKAAYPESNSGEYWIDPNEGDKRDAILVHCDMAKKATCVYPNPAKSSRIVNTGSEKIVWLSKVHGGMQVRVNQIPIEIFFTIRVLD